jgi:hypothetical protein
MKAVFDKVRREGKIKVVNKFNNNPKHPGSQSTFPDLFDFVPKHRHYQDAMYDAIRIDDNVNLHSNNHIIPKNKNFQSSTQKKIEKSYYENFLVKNGSWTVSTQLNSSKNIKNAINIFTEKYQDEKSKETLDENFMNDYYSSLFVINNHLIFSADKQSMMADFKRIIPNADQQKLISLYANPNIIHQAYLQLIAEHSEITQYQVNNSRSIYKVDVLDDGGIKLIATNLSDLENNNISDNDINNYHSFGIRATVLIYPNALPIIKYSHFIK